MREAEDWTDVETRFKLGGARIVATIEEGGALVEDELELIINEGRQYALSEASDDGSRDETLEYHFSFRTDSEPPPQSIAEQKARIVISGSHSNGDALQIQGRGWIGYDEQGRVEGWFPRPPRISILTGPDNAERLQAEARDQWARASSPH